MSKFRMFHSFTLVSFLRPKLRAYVCEASSASLAFFSSHLLLSFSLSLSLPSPSPSSSLPSSSSLLFSLSLCEPATSLARLICRNSVLNVAYRCCWLDIANSSVDVAQQKTKRRTNEAAQSAQTDSRIGCSTLQIVLAPVVVVVVVVVLVCGSRHWLRASA